MQKARADPDEDRLEADAGLGEDTGFAIRGRSSRRPGCRASGTTRTPARRQDAVRNEVEINAAVAYLFANSRDARVRRQEPAARRCEGAARRSSSRSAAWAATSSAKASATRRPAPHVRPAAGEHRQQDDLRVGLQLGARSEALQPRHLHAQPAPHRPQVADVATYLMTLKQAGGDRGQGHVRPTRHVDDVLLDYYKAVMPFEEAKAAAREARCRRPSSSSSGSG